MTVPLVLQGVVVQGHGVASGRSADSPYPRGSVAMQMPYFKALGLDLSGCWVGTMNVSIAPHSWALQRADYCFEQVTWTDLHPAETFSFVGLQLTWQQTTVAGWLYRPHPETKAAHHQSSSMMEIIAPHLNGVAYGDKVQLTLAAQSVKVD